MTKRKPKSKKRQKITLNPGEVVVMGKPKFAQRDHGWTVTHQTSNIHVIRINRKSAANFEQWILFMADNHHDSKAADHDMERRLLEQALERNAIVCGVGDQLDLMAGQGDRRAHKGGLRSSLLADNYFDRVIDEAAEFYAPYASCMAVMATGNHESAWLRYHESNPTEHLVRAIKDRAVTQLGAGGYGGYILFQVNLGGSQLAYCVRYQHGTGSGASPMSFGVLDTRRMYSWLEGVDSIVISHNHASNVVGIAREFLNTHNGVYTIDKRYCDLIRVGTTKDSWIHSQAAGGWEVEKGFGPSPCRQKWVRLFIRWEAIKSASGKASGRPRLCWEVMDAQ